MTKETMICKKCGASFEAGPRHDSGFCSVRCANTTHGRQPRRVYKIWCLMKQRCYYTNSPRYKDYGGRGITVCDEWRNSFESFRAWALSNGYADHLSIDRKDNSLGYSPANCRWATYSQQMRNRRTSSHTSVYRGVCKDGSRWRASIGINGTVQYLGQFSTEAEAAAAYDAALVEQTGESPINFPQSDTR